MCDTLTIASKRTAKDCLFTDLFSDPKYVWLLYQALHPEDKTASPADLKTVTIKSIIAEHPYNDLGFQVGERLLILVEAQSTWTPNILIRSFCYAAQTYVDYFSEQGKSLYENVKVELPIPELYILFTGKRKHKVRLISLREHFFKGKRCDIEVKTRVIYAGKKGDIIYQYITFCNVLDQQVKLYGKSRKALQETIRICKSKDILNDYLKTRERELMNIMTALFDQEEVTKALIASKEASAEKRGIKEGKKEGIKEGIKEGMLQMAIKSWQMFGKSFLETRQYIQTELKLNDKQADEAMKAYWVENS